jgi:YidC/Oxa1 family membrane protein insertase
MSEPNEPFDKKILIATVLLMGWLFIYFTFIAPKPKPAPPPAPQATSGQPAAGTPNPPPPAPAPSPIAPAVASPTPAPAPAVPPPAELIAQPEQTVWIENERFRAALSSRGGRIVKWELKDYRQTIKKDSAPVQLVPNLAAIPPGFGGTLLPDVPGFPAELPMRVTDRAGDRVVFEGTLPTGLTVRKTVTFSPEKYMARQKVELVNGTGAAVRTRIGTELFDQAVAAQAQGCGPSCGGGAEMLTQRNEVGFVRRSLEKALVHKAKPLDETAGVFWTGFDDVYFLSAVASTDPEKTGRTVEVDQAARLVRTRLIHEAIDLAPGATGAREFVFYLGPKTKEGLVAAGFDFDRALDYGWFGAIADVCVRVLKFFHKYVKNWGIAIILLTIVVRVLLYPLTLKSYQSMSGMQRIQPLMQQVREQYKDDKQKMNEAMMRLYKEHGINPAGGCLPILLQLPIFIALYRAIYQSIELRHAAFGLWIQDLSAPDPYYVTPIVMGLTQWITQKLTPTAGDPAQVKMMQWMPVLFTFLFLNFPSGLVLYWLVSNILAIAQQQWIRSRNPIVPIALPKAPAPEAPRRKAKKGA